MRQLLTNKCKEDFEAWYKDLMKESRGLRKKVEWFDSLPLSMQYGIVQDFADSVNMPFIVKHESYYKNENNYGYWINGFGWGLTCFLTRHEAREEAIKKFNEIYNEL